jgi:hypothetical protein
MSEPLSMWTVYDHPRDFPEHFVARRWEVTATSAVARDAVASDDLPKLRAWLADLGLARMPRNDGDDPAIIETWL